MSNIRAGRDVSNVGAGHDAINISNAHKVVLQIGDHSRIDAASRFPDVWQNSFQPSFHAPANPREVLLNFGNPLDYVQSQTQEAKVLHELLREDCNQEGTRVVTVYGKGGVGKSCILRALAGHEKLKERFPDGIYFLSLGMDANLGTLIQGLIEITRLSGGQVLGTELRGEDNLQIVLKKVGEWLTGKTCLLLADDFWQENGLGADIVTALTQMLSDMSMLVVTTRFSSVATKGTNIEIKPLGTTSEKAKKMLLRYSMFDWNEVEPEKARPAFDKLLRMCGGLPIFLAIVGKAVARIELRFKHKSESSSAWEECVWMLEDSELLDTNVEGYKGLGRTLHMSLKLLSEDCGKLLEGLSPYSISEMHRAFCVFRKQATIPISVCRRLWRVDSDRSAWKIGMAFADVGLVDMEIERKGDGIVRVIRLHDLVQIFAVKCAKGEGEVMKWHKKLLEGYISKTEGRESVRRWWDVEERIGEEYLFGNLCRHLASSGNVKELGRLLLSGEWTKLRHKHGGLSAWNYDCSEYLGRKIAALSACEKEIERGMRLVRDSVVESWAAVHGNMQELGFQVFGRLVDCENSVVGKYLKSVKRLQGGLWLKPIQRLWMRPGEGGLRAEFDLGGNIQNLSVQKVPFIAVVAIGKKVTIVDLKEMTVRSQCIGRTDEVRKMGTNTDGKRVFSWSPDCTVRQWDIQSGKEVTDKCIRLDDEERDEDDRVTCAAFCRNKSFVITGSDKGKVKVWDLYNGERIGLTMYAAKPVRRIEVSPNGQTIASGVDGGALLLWDVRTFTPLGGELKGHFLEMSSIAFSPNGRYVASAGGVADLTIRLWDVESRMPVRDPFGFRNNSVVNSIMLMMMTITFSEDGQHIISGHYGGLITVWDVASGAAIRSWKAHSHGVRCVAITSDGSRRYVVSGGGEGIVRVWDLEAAKNVKVERIQHDGAVECVAASPNGRFFVSASFDKTLRVWNADGTALGGALCGHEKAVTCVAVSPDSRRLVSGSQDCTVRVWDVATGAQVGNVLRGHERCVNCVAYSKDGRFVVSGSSDCTARVWKVIDYPEVNEDIGESASKRVGMGDYEFREVLSRRESLHLEMILNHELLDGKWNWRRIVTSVTISPDGQKVLCGLWNGEIWVWDLTCRKCVYRTQSRNGSGIVRIEISEMNELLTMNYLYEKLRWRLDEEGGLKRVLENDKETGVTQPQPQQGSELRALNSIAVCGRTVQMSGNGKKIATLPGHVMQNAWKYDAQRRVLCTGLWDGRVLFFQVMRGVQELGDGPSYLNS